MDILMIIGVFIITFLLIMLRATAYLTSMPRSEDNWGRALFASLLAFTAAVMVGVVFAIMWDPARNGSFDVLILFFSLIFGLVMWINPARQLVKAGLKNKRGAHFLIHWLCLFASVATATAHNWWLQLGLLILIGLLMFQYGTDISSGTDMVEYGRRTK